MSGIVAGWQRGLGSGARRSPAGLALAALLLCLLVLAGCAADTGQWQALNFPFPVGDTIIVSMTPDPHVPQLFYAGTSNGQVLRLRIESLGAVPGAGIPSNAAVSSLYADPAHAGRVLAGTSRGIYLSSDYGDSWRAFGSGLPSDDGIDALVGAPASGSGGAALYAGSEQHGVFVSHDAGATWMASSVGLPANVNVYSLTVDPASNMIFAALVGHGIYASSDGGQTWTARNSGDMASSDGFAVLVGSAPPGGASKAPLFAGTSKGLFSSADGGQSWQPAGLNTTRVIALAGDPTSASTLYAGTSSAATSTGTIYRSADGGAHWSVLAPGLSHAVAAIVVLSDQHKHPVVFAASGVILRYPAIGGSTGGPLSTIVTVIIFLVILVVLYWLLRRTRRQLLGPVPSMRPAPGSHNGQPTPAPPQRPRTTATGQAIPPRSNLGDEVSNPWTGEAGKTAEGGNGGSARHPELN